MVSLLVAGLDYLLMAYIADVSDDKNRSANFGMIGAAFGLGLIIGPAIGGLLGHYDAHYPFLAAAGMNLSNFIFGLLILPESLPSEMRRKLDLRRVNPLNSLSKIFQAKNLLGLLLVYFFFQLAGQTHPSIWTLYTESRFQWTTAEVGFSLAVVGGLSAIAQGWLTRVIVPRMGERRAVIYGAFGYAISFVFFGAATECWMMYVILVFSAAF